jgi:Holliday junction resolvase RusA-like endonuclease
MVWNEDRKKSFATNYTSSKDPVQDFKRRIVHGAKAAGATVFMGPVYLDILYVFSFTGYIYKTKSNPRRWHTSRPDLSNTTKAIEDCLEGVCYKNDSQICWSNTIKIDGSVDETPRTVISIFELVDEDLESLNMGDEIGSSNRVGGDSDYQGDDRCSKADEEALEDTP